MHFILFSNEKNASQTTELINSTFGDTSVSYETVRKWFARFRDGNFSFEDDPRPGAVKKFEDEELQALLDENPCQTQEELAEQLRVSQKAISD